jgi:phage FluMu gp28-like protein
MPILRRLNIDKSGMGLSMYESLEREFPGKVEGVQFTQATKEIMAVKVKRLLEEHKVRLPNAPMVEAAFRSVRRTIMPTGNIRFDADYDDRHGHADHFWAFALAAQACGYGTSYLGGGAAVIGPREIEVAMREKREPRDGGLPEPWTVDWPIRWPKVL